jgi:hypothetical protein
VGTSTPTDSWLYLPAIAQIVSTSVARTLHIHAGRVRLARLLLACGLFAIILPTEIAYDSELFVSRRIFGIPPHYAITAVTVLIALVTDARYYSRLASRPIVLFGLLLFAYVLVIGVLRHGISSYMLRSDIYTVRWFFVGFVLMRLAITSGMLRWYLVLAAIVVLLVMSSLDYQATLGHQIDTGTKRAVLTNVYPAINCGTIMIGLGVMAMWPRSLPFAGIFAAVFALLVLGGAIRTSTRSLFIQQAFCLAIMLVSLSRDPRMRGRGRQLRRAIVFFVLVGAACAVWLIISGGFLSGFSQIGERLGNTDLTNDGTVTSRFVEMFGMLSSLTVDEWILGKGFGGMFFSTLGYWQNTPHIAVAGWLQKGGLAVFFVVIYFAYLKPGFSLARQLWQGRRRLPFPAPILVVGPVLVSWASLTLMSGGLDVGSLLGLGGLVALWMQLFSDEQVYTFARGLDERGRTNTAGYPSPGSLVSIPR